MKPTVEYIKSNRLHVFGWGTFKRHLVRLGVIKAVADPVPAPWMNVFNKACGK